MKAGSTRALVIRSIAPARDTKSNHLTSRQRFFHEVSSESLAEALLNAEGRGAVSVWASSGLSSPRKQVTMNQTLVQPISFHLIRPLSAAEVCGLIHHKCDRGTGECL